MALTKKQMGVDAYKWCLFLKKEFKITDSVASAIYYKYVKGVLADRGLLEIGYKPTRELDSVWIPKFRADLQNFVKDVKGIGLQNYLRIVNGFNFDYFTITTFNVLIEDFIANGTEGSTILPFSKFFEYVIKITEDYKQQYNRTVVDKITRENVLDRIRVSDVLLLDVHCKVIDVNQEGYADKVEFITSREAYWVEKQIYRYLKALEKEKYDFVTDDIIDFVLKKNKVKLNEGQNQAVRSFRHYGFNIITGKAGCLNEDTEVLTPNGWIKISEWNNQPIMEIELPKTMRATKDLTGVFRQPKQYIKKEVDQFYRFKGNVIDMIVSENHNNIHTTTKGFYHIKSTKEIYDDMQDRDKKYTAISIPETFEYNGKGLKYTDDYIRLKVCVFADGSFCHNTKPNVCYVNVKKKRKQERVEWLLKINNIPYKIYKSAPEYKRYVFEMDNNDKVFKNEWFYNTTTHQKEIIIDELKYWDGSLGKGNRLFRYFTTIKQSAEIIQLIGHSVGYRVNISLDIRENKPLTYCLNFSQNKYGTKNLDIDPNKDTTSIEKIEVGKYMYCFETTSGYFLIRQNNKIYVTGNSGKSFTSKQIIDSMIRAGYDITLLTPTAISAKVLTNFTGRQAYTFHKYFMGSGGSSTNKDDEEQKIESINEQVYYIDECSMLGLEHYKMLVTRVLCPALDRREQFMLENPDAPKEEIPKLPKIVMVGDTNQLPSISAGSYFRDFIDLYKIGDLKCNYINLTQIMRAKSDTYIPYLCDKYCVDYSPMEDTMYMNEEPNVFMLPLSEELETGDALGKFIYEYMQEMNSVDPNNPYNFENTTIMLPQKVGDKGTKKINEILDTLYKKDNPKAKTIGMVMKNNYELMIFNGDRFRLEGKEVYEENHYYDRQGNPKVEIVYEYTVTMLDDDREVKFKDGDVNWELAYCSTVHKLQGCTSENVIFVASRTHTFMLTKQLVYTALSRASKTLTVLYDKFTFENARKRDTKYNRKTFLGEIVKLRKGKGGR